MLLNVNRMAADFHGTISLSLFSFAFQSKRLLFSGKRNLAISFVFGISAGRFAGDRPSLQLYFVWVLLAVIVWPPAKMLSNCAASCQVISAVSAEIASYVCT